MSNSELKEALLSKCPVIYRSVRHGEMRYKRIQAIRYVPDKANQIAVHAELLDYNDNSVTIASGKDVFVNVESEGKTYGSENRA
ncbi:MAG: hypothetical protein K2N36_08215 [Ruminiclostridium sp.]|nr:hypothetical protein [Ruminiclostridium sp.]